MAEQEAPGNSPLLDNLLRKNLPDASHHLELCSLLKARSFWGKA